MPFSNTRNQGLHEDMSDSISGQGMYKNFEQLIVPESKEVQNKNKQKSPHNNDIYVPTAPHVQTWKNLIERKKEQQ